MSNIYGYVRVSTKDQNEERQILTMKKLGVPERNIIVEKESGKDFDRKKYKRLIEKMKKDDLLCVSSIDRLGRNYEEIQNQWRRLTKSKGIDIYVVDMPLLDTRIGKNLIGTFVSDIVLQVLSFAAENERNNIKERQKQGIYAAKLRGVRFGRPPGKLPDNFKKTVKDVRNGLISIRSGAKICGMPVSTFRYRMKKADFRP